MIRSGTPVLCYILFKWLKILFYNVFYIIMILGKVIDNGECAKKNQSFKKFSLTSSKV